MIFISTSWILKKETLQNKSWKRTSLASEQIKRKYNHCFTALIICQDGRPTLELFSHIVCLHQVQFENCNNCLQLTPVSYEGNKKVCSLWHMNTHINMGGGSILRTLLQTQDQVTGDNWCYHRQKQNQTKNSDNHVLPLLCGRSLGSVGVNSPLHAGVCKFQSKFAYSCCTWVKEFIIIII